MKAEKFTREHRQKFNMKKLTASEISETIKKRIESFAATAEIRSEGTIVSVEDGIVRIYGLNDVMQGEMVEFPGHIYGNSRSRI